MIIIGDKEQVASELRSSLLDYIKYFYPILTGREFIVSQPIGRESHHIIICRELSKAARLEIQNQRLLINVSPGSGKSTMLAMWVSWTLAKWADARFLYISYSKVLAAKHTETIKRIMQLPHYNYLFDVRIRHDSKAREYFQTTDGGAVAAFGSGGAITGQDAGLPGLNRFSGAVIIDDAHKPDEVHSDTIRKSVIDNYRETIQQRARGINVPTIFLGQRLHEDDLAAYLLSGKDGYEWEKVILKSIDEAGNALYPEVNTLVTLLKKQETDPYVFSSQYQQDPIPAGGALFKPEWFVMMDEEPQVLYSFITADTAETAKSYNDATAFSFWGIYEIESYGIKTGQYGLHWIDTLECRIEPKDLKPTFLDFWQQCMHYKKPPQMIAIEKKSTGGTLLSLLDEIRTAKLMDIPRTREQGCKTKRFLEIQPYIAERRVSFPVLGRHVKMCLEHMAKITSNETHRWDDICFVAGTKIATKRGYKNIEEITIHDQIITPFGYGKVIVCGTTGTHPTINNKGLSGTPNHPVFYGRLFAPLDTVTDDDKIHKLSFLELFKWRYQKLLFSMESPIDLWDRNAISLVKQKKDIEKVPKDCMWRFGNFIADKQYLKGMSFIIKTMIILITVMRIWNVFQIGNISRTIKRIGCAGIIAMTAKNTLNWFKKKLRNCIEAMKVEGGTKKTQNQPLTNDILSFARFVKFSSKEFTTASTVQKNVTMLNMRNEPEIKEVYNLTVKNYGVYYANDILVSNCDTAADAIKIALIDKAIISSQVNVTNYTDVARIVMDTSQKINRLRKNAYVR
ncbi:MAG TPA: hypothetical protein VHZ76_03345 [Gammaproteobacteria bacterium]|jgi:hypothetical protein|nr:hypothetical protein [Gammaproteobacteria bacterium]